MNIGQRGYARSLVAKRFLTRELFTGRVFFLT